MFEWKISAALSGRVLYQKNAVTEPALIQLPSRPSASNDGDRPAGVSLKGVSRVGGNWVALACLVAGLVASNQGLAGSSMGTTSPATALHPGDQLEQLLSPIALYPDPLLAMMLTASTVQPDISAAVAYLNTAVIADPTVIDHQPWDQSVKALARYPDIARWMSQNPEWTAALGAEFLNRPEAVMKSIQQLRKEALAAGTLVDTPQVKVLVEGDVIRILPADPRTVYVPQYDPSQVYDTPPQDYSDPPVNYGWGYPAGAWLVYDCDWDHSGVWMGSWQPGWNYRPEWRFSRAFGSYTINGHHWRPDPYRPYQRPDLNPSHRRFLHPPVQPPTPFTPFTAATEKFAPMNSVVSNVRSTQSETSLPAGRRHVEVVRATSVAAGTFEQRASGRTIPGSGLHDSIDPASPPHGSTPFASAPLSRFEISGSPRGATISGGTRFEQSSVHSYAPAAAPYHAASSYSPSAEPSHSSSSHFSSYGGGGGSGGYSGHSGGGGGGGGGSGGGGSAGHSGGGSSSPSSGGGRK
jgi:hypothetical protein